MNKNDCFFLGHVAKIHGFKGEVSIKLDVDAPENYHRLESVFIEINEKLVPFFIDRIDIRDKGFAIVKINGIDIEEKAQNLVHTELYLPLNLLPPLKGNKFYYHEVAGFRVIDKNRGDIGIIEQVLDFPHQAVLQVMLNEKEILIPVNDEIINKVDRQNKTIEVTAPEGLIEIYI